MNGLITYQLYCSLKAHFSNEHYDFVKFGKNSSQFSETAFTKRKDRVMFSRLENLYNKRGGYEENLKLIISSFFFQNERCHVLEMIEHERIRKDFLIRRMQFRDATQHYFNKELELVMSKYRKNLNQILEPKFGQIPELILLSKQNIVSPETLILLDIHTNWINAESKFTTDDLIWPTISRHIMKFRCIMRFTDDVIQTTKTTLELHGVKLHVVI